MEKGRVVVTVYLDFSRDFHTVSGNIFMDKVVNYRIEKLTVRCVAN